MTDHASITLIPPLIRRIRSAAPEIRLEVSQWQDRAYEAVIEGKLDAAFGAEHSPSALQSELLFEVDFVCAVGTAQRVRSPRLTLAQYLQLPHVVVETWAGEQTPVDRPLAQFGAKRRVVLSVPFFAAAMFAVAKLGRTCGKWCRQSEGGFCASKRQFREHARWSDSHATGFPESPRRRGCAR